MLRARFAPLKHILYAALLLVFLLSITEVGLRTYALCAGPKTLDRSIDDDLVAACWQTHHHLKPMTTVAGKNPDTDEPLALSTNSFGLRGPEIVVPKPAGVYRIVCLGDEHVLSAGSEQSQIFCERLREYLQPRTLFTLEVVNAGIPGYCPLLSYLQVKHNLLTLQPDLLILNFDMSDVADDQTYRRNTQTDSSGLPLACPHAGLEGGGMSFAQKLDKNFLAFRYGKALLEKLPFAADRPEDAQDIHARRGRYAWLNDSPPDWDLYTAQALSPIDQLRAVADRSYMGFLVATYPAPWQVSAKASHGQGVRARAGVARDAVYANRRPFELIAEYLEQRAIPFCDASSAFAANPQPEELFLANAAEFSPAGHDLYARELAAFLLRSIPGIWKRDTYESEATPAPGQMATRIPTYEGETR